MKRKWILRAATALIVVLVLVVVVLAFSLGAIVKKGVETIGPKATGVEVKLKSAKVWLLGSRAQLDGFVLGNPPGCKTPSAISVDSVSVRIKPGSVFSDKLVVDSINVKSPVITLEGGLMDNNLKTIERNLDDYVGSSSAEPSTNAAESERRLQVNQLVITDAKLQVNLTFLGGRAFTLSIPEIHLTDIGDSPRGETAAEVGQQALRALVNAATEALAKNAGSLGQGTEGKAKGAFKKATDAIKGLFH